MDVSDELSQELAALARKAAAAMNLRLAGIDLILDGGIGDDNASAKILEINSAPGLDGFALIGEAQEERVRSIYGQIAAALFGPA